jgi:hypothetical protein
MLPGLLVCCPQHSRGVQLSSRYCGDVISTKCTCLGHNEHHMCLYKWACEGHAAWISTTAAARQEHCCQVSTHTNQHIIDTNSSNCVALTQGLRTRAGCMLAPSSWHLQREQVLLLPPLQMTRTARCVCSAALQLLGTAVQLPRGPAARLLMHHTDLKHLAASQRQQQHWNCCSKSPASPRDA